MSHLKPIANSVEEARIYRPLLRLISAQHRAAIAAPVAAAALVAAPVAAAAIAAPVASAVAFIPVRAKPVLTTRNVIEMLSYIPIEDAGDELPHIIEEVSEDKFMLAFAVVREERPELVEIVDRIMQQRKAFAELS